MVQAQPSSRRRATGVVLTVLAPLVGFVVLLLLPATDRRWEHDPSHFWLVLGCALAAGAVALAIGGNACRRGDARLFLVSLALTTTAEFFVLHALATPGVLLDHPNAGFVAAMPVGLVLASGFAVWSSVDFDGARARALVARAPQYRIGVFAVAALWAVASLGGAAPLDGPLVGESATTWLWALSIPGIALYAIATVRYFRLARARRSDLVLAISACWLLLAEALLATAASRSWHLSWWEWHLLVLLAVAGVAIVVRRQPESEPFADLYLDTTAGGTRAVTVLFADLVAFSTYSEQHTSGEVQTLVNTYFDAVIPAVTAHGGHVDRYIGDAVMVTWNVASAQPDHAELGARAALAFQAAAATVSTDHPGWPVFRVGLNSGEATTGLIGGREARGFSVLGDTVNIAARLEGVAPPGGVALSGATLRGLDGARVRSLGEVQVKGRKAPVEVWLLQGLDG